MRLIKKLILLTCLLWIAETHAMTITQIIDECVNRVSVDKFYQDKKYTNLIAFIKSLSPKALLTLINAAIDQKPIICNDLSNNDLSNSVLNPLLYEACALIWSLRNDDQQVFEAYISNNTKHSIVKYNERLSNLFNTFCTQYFDIFADVKIWLYKMFNLQLADVAGRRCHVAWDYLPNDTCLEVIKHEFTLQQLQLLKAIKLCEEERILLDLTNEESIFRNIFDNLPEIIQAKMRPKVRICPIGAFIIYQRKNMESL